MSRGHAMRPESGPAATGVSDRQNSPIATPLRPHVAARRELAVLTGSRRAGAPPLVPGRRGAAVGPLAPRHGSETPSVSSGRKTPGMGSDDASDGVHSGRGGRGEGTLPPPGPPGHARSHAFSRFCLGRFYRDTTITGATLGKKREVQRERIAREREQRQRERFEEEAAAVGELEQQMAMRAERQRKRRQRLQHRAAARVQRVWRGVLGRRHAAAERARREQAIADRREARRRARAQQEEVSAVTIQRTFRGHAARQEIATQQSHAARIQAQYRGHSERREHRKRRAALSIQRAERGRQARQAAQRRRQQKQWQQWSAGPREGRSMVFSLTEVGGEEQPAAASPQRRTAASARGGPRLETDRVDVCDRDAQARAALEATDRRWTDAGSDRQGQRTRPIVIGDDATASGDRAPTRHRDGPRTDRATDQQRQQRLATMLTPPGSGEGTTAPATDTKRGPARGRRRQGPQ